GCGWRARMRVDGRHPAFPIPTMATESEQEHLVDLLARWEQLRDRGTPATAESLCADCPQWVAPLKRMIADLEFDDSAVRTQSLAGRPPTEGPTTARATSHYFNLQFHDCGGLGEVFHARHKELGRDVALKFLKKRQARSADSRRRFLREAEITARLE